MHKLRALAKHLGLDLRRSRPKTLRNRLVTLSPPASNRKGRALLAYNLRPFLLRDRSEVPATHTNLIESLLIADVLLKLGYEVDVIDIERTDFQPERDYELLISSRKHFQIHAEQVGSRCLRIVHLDVSHWLYNNSVALKRCSDVWEKRGIALESYRKIEPNQAIEHADFGIMLGNECSIGTYSYSGKKIYPIPIPVYADYPDPAKDFDAIRGNFIWFGSRGFIHKGLDLVLEAFAEMPEYHLKVCGPIDAEPDFRRAYHRELYELPNIQTIGWVDVTSERFLTLANDTVALIYPSCAEGQCGAVVTCMHAGIIPVASRQSGVDISPAYGRYMRELSVGEVKNNVRAIADSSPGELESMSKAATAYTRKHHTRERYLLRLEKVFGEALTPIAVPDRIKLLA